MSDDSPSPSPSAPEAGAGDRATAAFVGHRELLFSVVYNMLGSVSDTEDVLQETWLAWARRTGREEGEEIAHPRAYLVRIAVNQALARQAGISRRRETYVGPWLPEPLVTAAPEAGTGGHEAPAADAADAALRRESVSMAMLVVLETLTPLERAVFVLHEVFGYAHTEIAEILDRTPAAVRQLAHRARAHVQARRPRYRADRRLQRQVTERFIAAALGGDLAGLMALLAPEVTLWADGGGNRPGALPRPVSGRENVARLLTGYAANRLPSSADIRYRQVNGEPSVVVFAGDSPTAVMVVDLDAGSDQVTDIYLVLNPDKLSRVGTGAAADAGRRGDAGTSSSGAAAGPGNAEAPAGTGGPGRGSHA